MNLQTCTQCGCEKDSNEFYNKHAECIVCFTKRSKLRDQTLMGKYSRYKRMCKTRSKRLVIGSNQFKGTATDRNIEFNLPLDEFQSFWQESCHYCGTKINTIGLDRIDSNGNYDVWNVVSCCTICNRMKSEMTVKDFINHCRKT